jgi:hypothetical protein
VTEVWHLYCMLLFRAWLSRWLMCLRCNAVGGTQLARGAGVDVAITAHGQVELHTAAKGGGGGVTSPMDLMKGLHFAKC